MNRVVWYGGVTLIVVAAGLCWSAAAQQAYTGANPLLGSKELVTHFQATPAGPTQLTLVDPQTKVMAVYHVAPDTGVIQLKSVRNFSWDLMVEEFNSNNLSPADIRKMQQLQR